MSRIIIAATGGLYTAARFGLFGNKTIELQDENDDVLNRDKTLRYEGIGIGKLGVLGVGHYYDDDYIYEKCFNERWVWSIQPMIIVHTDINGTVKTHDRTTKYMSGDF